MIGYIALGVTLVFLWILLVQYVRGLFTMVGMVREKRAMRRRYDIEHDASSLVVNKIHQLVG